LEKILTDIAALETKSAALIVVTNEVGGDGGEYSESITRYIQALGRLNRVIAERFDLVAELVCGIPLALKGTLPV